MSTRTTSRSRKASQRDPQRTRDDLVSAGRKLFARRGLHGVAVAEIAKLARVSVGMINHHFDGKTGLYRACLSDFAERRLETLERYLAPPASKEEMKVKLELLALELLETHLKEPEVVAILLRDLNASDEWGPELEQRLFEFTPRLATFFSAAQEKGFIRAEVDPLVVAGIIYLSLSGLLQVDSHVARVTGASLQDLEYRRTVVKALLEVIFNGVLS